MRSMIYKIPSFEEVYQLLPSGMNGDDKDDIVQDIFCALYAKTIKPKELSWLLPGFIKAHYRNNQKQGGLERQYGAYSLYSKIPGTDRLRLIDTIIGYDPDEPPTVDRIISPIDTPESKEGHCRICDENTILDDNSLCISCSDSQIDFPSRRTSGVRRPCPICGKVIYLERWELRKNPHRYCSKCNGKASHMKPMPVIIGLPGKISRRQPVEKEVTISNPPWRPRSLPYIVGLLPVWRQFHNVEDCGLGGGWAEKNFLSLHTTCPNCGKLAHILGKRKCVEGVTWKWKCLLCDSAFNWVGEKFWPDRPLSLVVNGKRIHRASRIPIECLPTSQGSNLTFGE